MSIDIRHPQITETSDAGKIAQIHRYLFQLCENLNFALNAIDKKADSAASAVGSSAKASGAGVSQEAQDTFNSIKALIIKSADIVNAYYDAISVKLEGMYVAQSEFGAYTERTSAALTATDKKIEQVYTNMQTVLDDTKETSDYLIDVKAHINAGLLDYEDGIPIYGLEIGQTTTEGDKKFRKYARFVSDRLSFYDSNDAEVAYISDYQLYITNATITGVLTLGGYRIDTTNGLAFKWVGRG